MDNTEQIIQELKSEKWEMAQEIERLREEVQELEQIMEENNCAVGYLLTKRALKQNGAWKQKDSE